MRGKILRDPTAGAGTGLVMINGQQHAFVLDGVWRSDAPPVVGATVDAALGPDNTVTSMTLVPEGQLAKEQAEAALAQAKVKGAALAGGLVAKFGMPTLVALGVLMVGWFFLTAVSYNAGFLGKMDFTFWRVLGFINASNPMEGMRNLSGEGGSSGLYGILGVLALVGPLAGYFWKDRRAALGGVLPLLFMVIVGLVVRSVLGNMGGGFGSPRDVDEIRAQVMKGMSIGAGAYLSAAAAAYLAFVGAKNYLASR
jgi:hypothetical protein